jgi:hypothetical protein
LVDAVPEDRVGAIGDVLRATIEAGASDEQVHYLAALLRALPGPDRLATQPIRTFACAGTLSAEHDLAERVEEILRSEGDAVA